MSAKPKVKSVEIQKLLVSLETMSEYLIERKRKIFEKREFQRSVWEDACLKAGLIKKPAVIVSKQSDAVDKGST